MVFAMIVLAFTVRVVVCLCAVEHFMGSKMLRVFVIMEAPMTFMPELVIFTLNDIGVEVWIAGTTGYCFFSVFTVPFLAMVLVFMFRVVFS